MHGIHKPEAPHAIHTPGKLSDAIPGSVGGTAVVDAVAPHRSGRHAGELVVPTAAPGGAVLVRLRWSNAFSWLSSKAVSRRVDVLLPGEEWGALLPEVDPAERQARARWNNVVGFGL